MTNILLRPRRLHVCQHVFLVGYHTQEWPVMCKIQTNSSSPEPWQSFTSCIGKVTPTLQTKWHDYLVRKGRNINDAKI